MVLMNPNLQSFLDCWEGKRCYLEKRLQTGKYNKAPKVQGELSFKTMVVEHLLCARHLGKLFTWFIHLTLKTTLWDMYY